jgi:hypothetical protein
VVAIRSFSAFGFWLLAYDILYLGLWGNLEEAFFQPRITKKSHRADETQASLLGTSKSDKQV